jgi:hypothetical protein
MEHNMLIEFFRWAFSEHPYITIWIIIQLSPPSSFILRGRKD